MTYSKWADLPRKLPPPDPGTGFNITRWSVELPCVAKATLDHSNAAAEFTAWRRGFWDGFEEGFWEADYRHGDPEA